MDDKQRGLLQATIMAGVALGVASATGCFASPIYCCPISHGDGPAPQASRVAESARICDIDATLFAQDAGPSRADPPDLSVSPDGTHLYVHQPDAIYRFDVNGNTACTLTLDSTFADAGILHATKARVFETESGVFLSDATGLHAIGSEAACSLPGLLAVTDRGDLAFALSGRAGADKFVVSVDPRTCPSQGTQSAGKLASVEHVAAGMGDGVVHFASGLQGSKGPRIETYDPTQGKVTRTADLTTNTPYPNQPPSLGVEAIRGCGQDELCVATGPKRALNRFDKSGTIVFRQQLDTLDYLPEAVRKVVDNESRVALTRNGRAFYAYIVNGKLGILRASVNDAAQAPDAGTDANKEAAKDSGPDSSANSDASDASDASSD